MGRGRKRTPTEILQARGSDRAKDRLKAPKPPAATPTAPTELTGDAKREWNRVTKILSSMGMLTTADRVILTTYCQAWGDYLEARRKLAVEGFTQDSPSGARKKSTWLVIAHDSFAILHRCCAELGLTPSGRAKLATLGDEKKDDLASFIADAPRPPQLKLRDQAAG